VRSTARGTLLFIAALGLVVAAASMRVVVSGEREIAASTAALEAGDPRAATVHARRAAGWYAPGAPHVRVAYERLVALATTAEKRADVATALFAWEAVRTAAIETRWIVTPHAADLERANREIARLMAAKDRPAGTRTDAAATVEAEHLAALARDETPRAAWILTLAAGFAAWVGGAAWLARRAVDATGHVVWRRSTAGLVVAAAGVLLYLISIYRA
jgi:hypothetical protein